MSSESETERESKEIVLKCKPNTQGSVYSTIWKNGEIVDDCKELWFSAITPNHNKHRKLIDYDWNGAFGLRLCFDYHCEPYELNDSNDTWLVHWELIDEEWDLPKNINELLDGIID